MKVLLPSKVKFALLPAVISLAFVSQTFAVLRPLFPAKPMPPFNGELVITGDDLVVEPARKHMLCHRNQAL